MATCYNFLGTWFVAFSHITSNSLYYISYSKRHYNRTGDSWLPALTSLVDCVYNMSWQSLWSGYPLCCLQLLASKAWAAYHKLLLTMQASHDFTTCHCSCLKRWTLSILPWQAILVAYLQTGKATAWWHFTGAAVHPILYIQPLTNDCPTFSARDGVLWCIADHLSRCVWKSYVLSLHGIVVCLSNAYCSRVLLSESVMCNASAQLCCAA